MLQPGKYYHIYNHLRTLPKLDQKRRGTLFEKPFKHKEVTCDNYFMSLIHYIHYNPVHHGFTDDLRTWKYSSYESFFSEKRTNLKRDEVVTWFSGVDAFYTFHQMQIDNTMVLDLEY